MNCDKTELHYACDKADEDAVQLTLLLTCKYNTTV